MKSRFIFAHLRRPFLAYLMAVALTVVAGCDKSREGESKIGYRLPAQETHFTFTLEGIPAEESFQGRPPMTLRVPREYVWFENILRKNGRFAQVPLEVQLPGPMSTPSLEAKKGTQEYENYMKNRLGRFIVDLGTGSGVGGRAQFLHALKSGARKQDGSYASVVYDGEVYGLVRYSPFRCYFAKDLEEPNSKKFIESKPADDPRPEPNCRLNRGSAIYFSPSSVTSADEIVFIECSSVTRNCEADFDLGRHGMNMNFNQDQLARWAEIVGPTRDLIRSFIVREVPAVGTVQSLLPVGRSMPKIKEMYA